MKIYGFPLSPFVRKVMLVAHEKNLENEIVPANPMQPSEDFLAASPYGKIPAIDDDGFQLADSTAIAVYLDAKHPAPALLPADPQARARAGAAGGKAEPTPTQDHGFMYGSSFEDPDGHIWENVWMNMDAVPAGETVAEQAVG